jgi:hypothetical protein
LAITGAFRNIFNEACKNVTRNFVERLKMVVDKNGDWSTAKKHTNTHKK